MTIKPPRSWADVLLEQTREPFAADDVRLCGTSEKIPLGLTVTTVSEVEPRLLGSLPAELVLLACRAEAVESVTLRFDTPLPATENPLTGWERFVAFLDQGCPWQFTAGNSPAVVRPELCPASTSPKSTDIRVIELAVRRCVPQSSPDAIALRAGLLQLHDFLDESHQASQSIEGQGRHRSGDYWHAIMHRREGDFGNAKYWFRHVGEHPVFDQLVAEFAVVVEDWPAELRTAWESKLVRNGRWILDAFVDCCEAAAKQQNPQIQSAVEELQYRELLLLLAQTCIDAGARTAIPAITDEQQGSCEG